MPMAKIFCPLHRLKDRWTICKLTIQEKLWLFQMSLATDPLLLGFNPSGRLPFADFMAPELYTSIFLPVVGH